MALSKKLSFPLLITILATTLLIFPFSKAQNSPQDYVDAHNQARSQVGVGPVTWDPNLEQYAQNYANSVASCKILVHSGGPYGENLAAGSGDFMTGTSAVKMWVDEKADYDYGSNTCAPNKVCGHYTQVVWRDSVRIGCARRQCSDGWYYVICSYAPPGNFVGQRPY